VNQRRVRRPAWTSVVFWRYGRFMIGNGDSGRRGGWPGRLCRAGRGRHLRETAAVGQFPIVHRTATL